MPPRTTQILRIQPTDDQVAAKEDRKGVLFTEWTTMPELIEPLLARRGLDFVGLDDSLVRSLAQILGAQ